MKTGTPIMIVHKDGYAHNTPATVCGHGKNGYHFVTLANGQLAYVHISNISKVSGGAPAA